MEGRGLLRAERLEALAGRQPEPRPPGSLLGENSPAGPGGQGARAGAGLKVQKEAQKEQRKKERRQALEQRLRPLPLIPLAAIQQGCRLPRHEQHLRK